MAKSQPICFDNTGVMLSRGIGPGARSPEKRSHKLSFFDEVTAEQLKTYSPVQIATILKQRENLLDVLSEQHQASGKADQPYYLPSGRYRGGLSPPPGLGYPVDAKPWVPREGEECQAKYCHHCRPSCESRSYLSLDAVVNGEIPPAAATGFGFHKMRARPVVDVRLMRYVGLRPVSWPRAEDHTFASSPSSRSSWSVSEVIDAHLMGPDDAEYEPLPELGEVSTTDSIVSTPSLATDVEHSRPAWSPPSTPTRWTGVARGENGTTTFENTSFVCDGRSPDSLKTNGKIRRQVIDSIAGLMDQEVEADEVETFQSLCSFESPDQFNLLRASLEAMTPPISSENRGRQRSTTPIIADDLEEDQFHQGSLDFGEDVAGMQDNDELEASDIIAQA